MLSEYSIQFWVMAGTLLTAGATVGLVIGAFMAWHKAKQTLDQMQSDAKAAANNFDRDIMLREAHEGARRSDAVMTGLLAAASDLVAATNVSLPAVYDAGMELRKANLAFVMRYELQKGQGSLEQFCSCLVVLAKSSQTSTAEKCKQAREVANYGFQCLFQCLLALHREDIEMPEFLDGLYSFVEDVALNYRHLIPAGNWEDERIVS